MNYPNTNYKYNKAIFRKGVMHGLSNDDALESAKASWDSHQVTLKERRIKLKRVGEM